MDKTDRPLRMYRLNTLITIALTTVIVFSVSLFGIIQSYRMYAVQEKGVRKQLLLNSQAAANGVSQFLVTTGFNLEAVATLNVEQLTSENPAVRSTVIARLMRLLPAVRQITLLNAEGVEITKMSRFTIVREEDYSSLAHTSLWETIATGNRYLSAVRFGQQTTEPIVSMAHPLGSLAGGVIGAVVADIDLTHLWHLVNELTLGERGCSYVVDGEARVLAHSDMTRIKLGDTLEHDGLPQVLSEEHNRQSIVENSYGNPAMAASAAIENTDWSFVTELPIKEAQREASADLLLSGLILLFTVLSSVVIGIFLATRLSRSLNTLKEGASIVAAGDFDHRITASTTSATHIEEVHTLIAAFNRMVDHIAAKNKVLNERVEQLQDIYKNLPVLLWAVDREGIITIAEGSELGIFELEYGKSVGRSFFDDYQEVFPKSVESLKTCLTGKPVNYEIEALNAVYYVALSPIFNGGEAVTGVRGLAVNVTETRKATEEVRRLRNYLTNIIDSMPSTLVGVDSNGLITLWNRTAEDQTGIEAAQASGKPLADILPVMAKEMEKIKHSMGSKTVCHERKRPLQYEDGNHYEDLTIYPLIGNGIEGAVIRIDDVTEKVRMEELMIQSEKMLSVGGLAAGMAHEINNPLAGMLQTAEVMSSRLGEHLHVPASIKAAKEAGVSLEGIGRFMEARGILRMLNTINESGNRIAVIVANMLSFVRKGETVFSSHDLCALMDKTLELAATDYDLKRKYDFKQITIHREYDVIPQLVACEAAKIQQVFLNILTNGAQAMLMSEVDEPQFIIRIFTEASRKTAVIEIEDNGPGIADEVQQRIFEPFFTTKPVGIGTGLGLSVSYFIINEVHHGEIGVHSVQGQGATFSIRLPLEGE